MNYLTNFYKNKCSQLEEQIKLLEAYVRSPEQIRATAQPEAIKSGENMMRSIYDRGLVSTLPDAEAKNIVTSGGFLAAKERMGQIQQRADIRQQQIAAAINMIPEASYFGDHDAVRSLARVLGDIHGVRHGLGPTTAEDLRLFSAVHSGDYQPLKPEPPEESPQTNNPGDLDMMRRMTDRGIKLRGSEDRF